MKRRNFFATLVAMIALPKIIAEAKPKKKKVKETGMGFMHQLDVMNNRSYHPIFPFYREGEMLIGNQIISIKGPKGFVRPGDLVAVDKLDERVYCTLVENHSENESIAICRQFRTKVLCGIPVLFVEGKIRQFRYGKNPVMNVIFYRAGSVFKES